MLRAVGALFFCDPMSVSRAQLLASLTTIDLRGNTFGDAGPLAQALQVACNAPRHCGAFTHLVLSGECAAH